MHETDTEAGVAIVGGGLAGLTVAAYLAREGVSTRLFERSAHLGGRARTEQEGGFSFNLGPHALYAFGGGVEVLRELGIEPRGKVASTAGLAARGDRMYRLPSGIGSLLLTRLLGPREKLETMWFLATIGRVDTLKLREVTFGEWLRRSIRSEAVRALVEAIGRVATYVNAPELISADVVVAQIQLALRGVLYLDDGWQQLVDALRTCAEDGGATVHSGASVAAVQRRGDEWAISLADGSMHQASAVVLAVAPGAAASLLQDEEVKPLREMADDAVAVRAATLDLALSTLPDPKRPLAVGVGAPYYLSLHSETARLAPEGGAVFHVAKYLAPTDDGAEAEAELMALMDRLQPGWRDVVIRRRFLPQVTVANAIPRADRGGMGARPDPDMLDVPGLYVAGDWVGKSAWLADASFVSARDAARSILDRPGSDSLSG